jgi:hypothetical protein
MMSNFFFFFFSYGDTRQVSRGYIPSGYHREKKPNDVKHIYASENKMRVSFSEMPLEFFCSLCTHMCTYTKTLGTSEPNLSTNTRSFFSKRR